MRAIIAPFVLSIITLLQPVTAVVAAPTASIGGGATTIRLTQPFTTTLSSLNIAVSKVEESTVRSGAIVSPIIEGVLDRLNARGEVEHAGGIRFGRSPVFVRFTNLILDTTGATPVITADIIVKDSVVSRQPVFDVVIPNLTLPISATRRTLAIRSMDRTLRAEAAEVLNTAFTTTSFAAGLSVGSASSVLIFGRSSAGLLRGVTAGR